MCPSIDRRRFIVLPVLALVSGCVGALDQPTTEVDSSADDRSRHERRGGGGLAPASKATTATTPDPSTTTGIVDATTTVPAGEHGSWRFDLSRASTIEYDLTVWGPPVDVSLSGGASTHGRGNRFALVSRACRTNVTDETVTCDLRSGEYVLTVAASETDTGTVDETTRIDVDVTATAR